jgi:hypothetical protein
MNVAVTVYGRVVSIESTGPPEPDLPPDAPEGRRAAPRARVGSQAESREGDEAPKLWVHVHILLDAPHVGELQVNALESQVGGMLVVDGRARVSVSSN